MMERRLKLAKRLLNPECAVLIVTIDEKEYLRLGMLLQQVFEANRIQMVSMTISPRGANRQVNSLASTNTPSSSLLARRRCRQMLDRTEPMSRYVGGI